MAIFVATEVNGQEHEGLPCHTVMLGLYSTDIQEPYDEVFTLEISLLILRTQLKSSCLLMDCVCNINT